PPRLDQGTPALPARAALDRRPQRAPGIRHRGAAREAPRQAPGMAPGADPLRVPDRMAQERDPRPSLERDRPRERPRPPRGEREQDAARPGIPLPRDAGPRGLDPRAA